MTPRQPGDFGGRCLIGECDFTAELLRPTSSYFGLRKSASYLYGTLRDADGNLLRMIRGVGAEDSSIRSLFVASPGGQLQRDARSDDMWLGPTTIQCDGDNVLFSSVGVDNSTRFAFAHTPRGCTWDDGELLSLTGNAVGPGVQWLNSWEAGACFSATGKYRVRGTFLGRIVEGFVGHEIHYFSSGVGWLDSPLGQGREICWQQIANEYDDGSTIQATFAYGTDGWGFAMVHDEDGSFLSTTDVRAKATVRANGYPNTIRYQFADQSWTWRIDPQGERPSIAAISMLGADGVCTRDGDERHVRYSMGNSDWWTDGRADQIVSGLDHHP